MTKTATKIPYTPDTWNEAQRAIHEATSMEDAMHKASCLAGGWYRRPVTIYMQVTPDNDEVYQMMPAEYAPTERGWERCYTIDAHKD